MVPQDMGWTVWYNSVYVCECVCMCVGVWDKNGMQQQQLESCIYVCFVFDIMFFLSYNPTAAQLITESTMYDHAWLAYSSDE